MPAIADIDTAGSDRIRIFVGAREGDLVKQVPGVRYDGKSKTWTAPLAWPTCLALRGVFGSALTVGDLLAAWSWQEKARIDSVMAVKAAQFDASYLPSYLRPSQLTGAMFLAEAVHALLADDRGTGKTVQAIGALTFLRTMRDMGLVEDPFPVCVIATTSTAYNWQAEFGRFLPDVEVSVVAGTAGQRRKALEAEADVYVTTWANAKLHTRLAPYGSTRLTDSERTPKELNLRPWGTVIADEAHRAKDPKAKQTRAWWHLSHSATYRWAMTGTPMADNGADLWAIMHGLAPHEYPSRSAFIDRYLVAGENFFGGLEVFGFKPAMLDEFFAFFDRRFVRRTKEQVAPELPPKTPVVRWVDMTPKQAKAYKQMEKHGLATLDGDVLVSPDPLVKVGRLTQIAAAVPVLGKRVNAEGEEETFVAALEAPSCKVDELLDIIAEAPQEPLVVFAASRKLIDLAAAVLAKHNVSTVKITGEVSALDRQANVEDFQAGKAQVILCTFGAGSEGITLTRASTVVFLQRSWSLIENLQAEDRVHRIGQESDRVLIIDVVTRCPIERAVHETFFDKDGRLQEVARDEDWIRRVLLDTVASAEAA